MIKKFFGANDLFKNISTLVVGTFLAQLIPVFLQGFLRRIYPKEDFGVYAVFLSITGIFMVVASFRIEMAVVLPRKKVEAVNLAFAGFFLSFLFCLLCLLAILIFFDPLLILLNLQPQHGFMLYYLPPAIFFFSSYQVMNYYLVRFKAYREISVNKISRRVAEGVSQIALGLAGILQTGLILGNMAGHLTNNITGWYQILKKGFSLRLYSWRRQWELVWKYREFPVFNMIPAFLNALCMHLPLLFVNSFYSPEATAYFDLARWVLVFPASILTLSISQVLLQAISEKNNKKQSFRQDMQRLILFLAILGAGMVILTLLWAPSLFALYAGDDYYTSGIFAQVIVPGAALKLIVSPLTSIFTALKRIKVFSIWQAFYFLMIGSLILFRDADIMSFLRIYLIVDFISYGILLILIIYKVKQYEKSLSHYKS